IQNITIGNQILVNHGLYYSWHYYWISFGALLGSILLFYIAFGLALDYRTPTEEYHGSRPTKSLCQQQEKDYTIQNESDDQSNISKGKDINISIRINSKKYEGPIKVHASSMHSSYCSKGDYTSYASSNYIPQSELLH
uniref:Plant PDR ABC transporter associated domain-containing protein n=1 Tax=Aegilops tauschii subsp. strangulata TaxID=200361 RepID=A0A453QLK0_AEGTS